MNNKENIDELIERVTQTVVKFSRENEMSWQEVVLAMAVSMTLLTEGHAQKYKLRPDQIHQLHVVTGETMKAVLTGTMD